MRIESSVLYSQVHRVTRLRFILRKQGSGTLEGHPERKAIELCILRFYNTFQYKSVPRRFKKLVLTKRYIYIYIYAAKPTRQNEQVSHERCTVPGAKASIPSSSYFLYQCHSAPFNVLLYQHNRKGSSNNSYQPAAISSPMFHQCFVVTRSSLRVSLRP